MIKLSNLLLENGEEWSEHSDRKNKIWYHGRKTNNTEFSYSHVGGENAKDQDGPGFYFTNELTDAKSYAYPSGIIMKCQINYKKTISKTKTSYTQTKITVLKDLILKSPNIEFVLSNFGENKKEALVEALKSYMNYSEATEAYDTLANDFYNKSHEEYLKVMSTHYDGKLTHRDSAVHFVAFNPSIITVQETIFV